MSILFCLANQTNRKYKTKIVKIMNQSKFGLTRSQPTRQETRPDANQLPKMFVDVQGGGGSKVNEKEEKAPSVCVCYTAGGVLDNSPDSSAPQQHEAPLQILFFFFTSKIYFCFVFFLLLFSLFLTQSSRLKDKTALQPPQHKIKKKIPLLDECVARL